MTFLESLRSNLSHFLETRKQQPRKVCESDGPFQYEYIAISHVIGAKLPDDSPDPLEIANFSDIDAAAYLTQDWDQQYEHIDRANAASVLLLTGLVGIKRFHKLSRRIDSVLRWVFGPEWVYIRNLESQTVETRQNRLKEHSGSGCCLVYRARGAIDEDFRYQSSRLYNKVGVALDAIDVSAIRKTHESNVRSVATSVSIAMSDTDGSPEVRFLAKNVHLTGKDNLVIYVRTVQAGMVGVAITSPSTDEMIEKVGLYNKKLVQDRKLLSAASLFALSQHKSNDNLRSFMAAWSALEFLTNILASRISAEFWSSVESGSTTPPKWDKDLRSVAIEDYRQKDKFFLIASHFEKEKPLDDIDKFSNTNKMRGDYYHRLDVAEKDLPTREAQELFRKYLAIALRA